MPLASRILISAALASFLIPMGRAEAGMERCFRDEIRLAMQKLGMIRVDDLLGEYRYLREAGGVFSRDARKLSFDGVDGRDVYNPTAPFVARFRGKPQRMILGRTEETALETGTESIFYVRRGSKHVPLEGAPRFKLQDPFFSEIRGELIVGGVETYTKGDGELGYRTVFYRDRGRGIEHLERFSAGPDGMKDIRLVETADGKILAFTRPQGEVGGRGKIGATIIDRLEDLTPERIRSAPLLENQFSGDEWGGANAAYLLPDGTVGVLGHIAKFGPGGERQYYPMAFKFDPKSGRAGPIQILLERSDLPGGLSGKSKRPDLRDVLFSGGLVRRSDGTATLYLGAGDAEVYSITIADPFSN